MATVLQLRFPAHRYHATPWGAHVNEGRIEWPPSPWRLLRALISTGFTKAGWPDGELPADARSLFEHLAGVLPSYRLPPAASGHTRHYVDAAEKRPLIFDAWAHLDAGEVLEVSWPVDLPPAERALMAELAACMGYLGRAESWVEARLVDIAAHAPNCTPDEGGPPGPRFESVRVLCPSPVAAFAEWRARRAAAVEAEHAPAAGKRRTAAQQKKLDAALAPYPTDLIGALCAETARLQAQGWSAPPGSREITYWRRQDALAVGTPTQRTVPRVPPAPFVLLAISTPSRGTSALPPLHRVFPQGRLMHRALASVIGHQMGGDPELALTLLGRTPDGRAEHDHRHAHLLYLDLDGDQRLDHVLVHAPGGLDAAAQEALRRLRRTYMKGGAGELQVAVSAVGDADVLRGMASGLGEALATVVGPAGGSAVWDTATPWVPPRNLKRSGKDSLEGMVRAECQRRGLPELVGVEVLGDEAVRSLRHFVLHDETLAPPRTLRLPLRLRFAAAVQGPICLGYGAHVGLGRFGVGLGGG
jgi:CRISPR-associated protein Csb2